jgi:hypothetical protein
MLDKHTALEVISASLRRPSSRPLEGRRALYFTLLEDIGSATDELAAH